MAFRYFVPALASAGLAAAACSGTTTISNSADAMALSTCRTYSGSIALATGISDDIAIDGVQEITGSLIGRNIPHMSSLSGDSLAVVGDTFGLVNIQTLTTLSFPALTQVDTIAWQGLPELQSLMFTAGVSQASTVDIENTGLGSLTGIDLMQIDFLKLANNNDLDSISMQLGNVSTGLVLEANGQDLQVEFPNLIWANNMTIQNVTDLSIPSLASVNGSIGFYANYFDSVAAPNLTQVGGSLSVVSNEHLTKVSFPELKLIVGGLLIANNTHLENIDGFNRLTAVGGAVNVFGSFNQFNLPAITRVQGAMDLESSANIKSICNKFQKETGSSSTIRGDFTCTPNKGSASSRTGSSDVSSSSSSSTPSSAAEPRLATGATGLLGVVAALFAML